MGFNFMPNPDADHTGKRAANRRREQFQIVNISIFEQSVQTIRWLVTVCAAFHGYAWHTEKTLHLPTVLYMFCISIFGLILILLGLYHNNGISKYVWGEKENHEAPKILTWLYYISYILLPVSACFMTVWLGFIIYFHQAYIIILEFISSAPNWYNF